MLLIALVLGWAAFNWGFNASQAGTIDTLTGAKKASENYSIQFGVGAAIFGIVALVVLASGGGSNPQPEASARPNPINITLATPSPTGKPDDSASTIEARLNQLKLLMDKGMITEQEFADRRKKILDSV